MNASVPAVCMQVTSKCMSVPVEVTCMQRKRSAVIMASMMCLRLMQCGLTQVQPSAKEIKGQSSMHDAEALPVSLRSTDLIVSKSPGPAMGDEGLWGGTPNMSADWSARGGFDVLGSQPSWAFAAMHSMEAVH